MATPAKTPAVVDDDDDDLWDFSTPGGFRTPEQSPAQSSGDEDELKVLLPTKRRRLLKLAKTKTKPPDLVLLDSDSEGTDSDKDKLNVEEVKKAKAQGDFDDIDATAVLVANVPKKISKKDMETQLAILRNREALDQARRMVDSPFTECEEESPTRDFAAPKQSEEEEDKDASEKIVVKLSTKRHADPVKLRIGRHAPFLKMFEAFRELASLETRNWITKDTQLRFVFDGDMLLPNGTAESMDIEDDCVIEVHW